MEKNEESKKKAKEENYGREKRQKEKAMKSVKGEQRWKLRYDGKKENQR